MNLTPLAFITVPKYIASIALVLFVGGSLASCGGGSNSVGAVASSPGTVQSSTGAVPSSTGTVQSSTGTVPSPVGSSPPTGTVPSSTANYRVTFTTTWTSGNFPTQFPAGRHFSGLVGATHNREVTFWQPGQLATLGIKDMAELGSKTNLLAEVEAAKAAGRVSANLSGNGISSGETGTTLTFTADANYPLVTLVSMVAPSPDWFVGVHDLELYSNGQWKDKVDVNLEVYDAGTDDGTTFNSPNAESKPHVAIDELSSAAADSDFAQGIHRSSGKYVATFSFQRF